VKFLVRVSQKCFSAGVIETDEVVGIILVGIILVGIDDVSGMAEDGIAMLVC
jgi:hypothetical protein